MNRLGIFLLNGLKLLGLVCLASSVSAQSKSPQGVQLVVLGVAQDAGYPQAGCYQAHCMHAWKDHTKQRLATSLAIIDHNNKAKYLLEATPDIKQQLYHLHQIAPDEDYSLSGIFLTHAHMGHYAGLMHFGREAMGSKSIPVFTMPKMTQFLANNGPWEQLVKLNNILLKPLKNQQEVKISKHLTIQPIQVPHRDEYSETVGFKIVGPNKNVLFIPDIDKWQKWSLSIAQQVSQVDYALLDATFFSNGELPNRDMSEVPHPFVEESMLLLKDLSSEQKKKILFIHFNHTNPLLIENSDAQKKVRSNGFDFAREGMTLEL
jgi:pyrroloquinoline quinone biosynthesis protein B